MSELTQHIANSPGSSGLETALWHLSSAVCARAVGVFGDVTWRWIAGPLDLEWNPNDVINGH